jgi:hypothetical protein
MLLLEMMFHLRKTTLLVLIKEYGDTLLIGTALNNNKREDKSLWILFKKESLKIRLKVNKLNYKRKEITIWIIFILVTSKKRFKKVKLKNLYHCLRQLNKLKMNKSHWYRQIYLKI